MAAHPNATSDFGLMPLKKGLPIELSFSKITIH